MSNHERIEGWLIEHGISCKKGENPGVWWLSLETDARVFKCAAHLDEKWFVLIFRFSDSAAPLTADSSLYLLDLNDQLSIFKFCCDEQDRIYIAVHWPAEFLTFETLGYLTHEITSNIEFFYDHIQAFINSNAE